MKGPWRGVAWPAAVALAVLLVFAPAVGGWRTLSQRDTDRFFGPIRPLVVEALREWRLPLWNPYEAGGKPLFAEGVHSVLHPVSLLGAAVAPGSIDLVILGYLVAAALGGYALGRALGASPAASAGGALGYALSGFTVSMTGNLTFLAGAATLPWVMAAGRRAGAAWAWGPAATAAATASAVFAGDAQVTLLGVLLGVALAADAGGRRGAARAVAGVAVGALLGGVQLAATLELLPQTLRSEPLQPHHLVQWALAPGRLLEWIVPGLVRGPLSLPARAGSGEWAPIGFAESVYLGVPLLVAAALGAGHRRGVEAPGPGGRGRPGRLLAVAAALLTWLALGHHLWARPALDGVPVWGQFRYTEKLMGPLTLCLAALGALGVDAFGARRGSPRLAWGAGVAALAAAALLLGLALAPGASEALLARWFGGLGAYYRTTLAAGLPHALAGLLAVLAADRLVRPAARSGALALLLALAPAAAVQAAVPFGDPSARAAPWPALEGDGPAPRIVQAGAGGYGRAWGLGYTDAYARGLAVQRTPSVNVGARVDALDAYCAFGPRRFVALQQALGAAGPRLLRRFALSHLVVPLPVEPERQPMVAQASAGGRLVERDEALGREVWAVPHRPWAFFAGRTEVSTDPGASLRQVLELVAEGQEEAVVVEAPLSPPASPGRVLRVERSAEVVRIEAEAEGPGLLVVQDAWWPGWTAHLDGRPTEILAADHLVRAVPWPGGRHRLEMVYDPPGVRRGWWLSGLGAALLALLGALGWRTGRSGRASGGGAA